MEQLRTFGRELTMGSQGGWGQSKEFLDLVKSIGEARSKEEEDRIVSRDLEHLKRRLADPDVPRRKMKELLLHLVYAEMLEAAAKGRGGRMAIPPVGGGGGTPGGGGDPGGGGV